MENKFIQIIISAISFSIFFTEIHRFQDKWKLNFKPFNCSSCMSAWVSLFLFVIPDKLLDAFSIMFISGLLAPIINLLINKLWRL
jgi:hypothetical protein